MGFLNAMKGASNSWGMVTFVSDGSLNGLYAYLGPKNLINNRSRELMISSTAMKDIVFSVDRDVESVTVICATSDWVKYNVKLKSGLFFVTVIFVQDVDSKGFRKFSNNWMNFETTFGAFIQRNIHYNHTEQKEISESLFENKIDNSSVSEQNYSCEPIQEKKNKVEEFSAQQASANIEEIDFNNYYEGAPKKKLEANWDDDVLYINFRFNVKINTNDSLERIKNVIANINCLNNNEKMFAHKVQKSETIAEVKDYFAWFRNIYTTR